MKLTNIRIADCKQSASNVKGRVEGKEFDELVASIKEKGVLVPVLARLQGGPGPKSYYEVIAGNRRLAAAKEAGLIEIPAQVVEMDEVEAREAQIVENLQRQDIHPLDEGELYRQLIEKSKPRYEAKDIALKVGKSETYIRQRLGLTNLSEKAKKAFRDDKLNISQAIVLCRLEDEKQQNDILKEAVDYGRDADDLKEIIERRVYTDLASKPWEKNAKLAEMVGDSSKKPENLFGDKTLGTDPVAYAKQMAAFIEIKIREAQSKGEKLLRIATNYGTPDMKGVLGRDQYRVVTAKDKDVKEVLKGIVVEGEGKGRILKITTEKEEIKETVYKKSPAEIAKRKKEVEDAKKKEEDKVAKFNDAIGKLKFPLSKKHLDALLEFALYRCGGSYQQPAVKFLGAEIVRTEEEIYGSKKTRMVISYRKSLLKFAADNGDKGKLQVIFSLLMPMPNNYSESDKEFLDGLKKL